MLPEAPPKMHRRALLALILLTGSAAAQTPIDRLHVILARAAAATAALQSSLPSFACKEDVSSQEFVKKKLKRHVEFTADLTVQRHPNGDLDETFQPTNWQTILLHSESGLPYYVSGGFQKAMDYFAADRAVCYRFTLTNPQRIDFLADPAAAHNPLCLRETGLTGFALLDPAGDILHIERTVPLDTARRTHLVPFAAIDLAPVQLNNRTYRLSSRLVADNPDGRTTAHFVATYSQCHLFHATVTILPGSQPAGSPPLSHW